MKFVFGFALMTCCSSLAWSASVTFEEIARFDVGSSAISANQEYIGSFPSAVAWNGRQLYIAGFNSSFLTGQVAIVEIANASSTGLQSALYGPVFGAVTTPSNRGYSGLDIRNNSLAAAYDDGTINPLGIQAFDATDNSANWTRTARGGSGVAFDPGFPAGDPAIGAGIAWTSFATGRRALQDADTGADIWTTIDGLEWLATNAGATNNPRDLDFDPDTGDIYVRRSNDIDRAARTGDNAVARMPIFVDLPDAGNIVGQNISFLSNTALGDLIVFNDRRNTTNDQSFAAVVKVVDAAGAPLSATFQLIGGGDLPNGVGYYDFDFDAATQTLALVDFYHRNVHIFHVIPEPASGLLLTLGVLGISMMRRAGRSCRC